MLPLQVIAGAILGGFVGTLFGRVKVCSSQGCTAKGNWIAGMLAGAVCGAVLMYSLLKR